MDLRCEVSSDTTTDVMVVEVWAGGELVAEVLVDDESEPEIVLHGRPNGRAWRFKLGEVRAIVNRVRSKLEGLSNA